MSLRRYALEALRDELVKTIQLPAPPTIVQAPPSAPAVYPAMALLMDRFVINWTQNWDLEVDDSGNPLVGTSATLTRGARAAMTDGNRYLSRVGSMRGTGRIWCAGRHPSKREELEEAVIMRFAQDDSAPGRLLANMINAKVADFTIPWPWTVAATISDATWSDEMSFAERLWSYVRFDLDVDMLVPRGDPLVKTFVVSYDIETTKRGDGSPTADEEQNLLQAQLNDQGDLVPYP